MPTLTLICIDSLQDYFRQLMSDLPEPFALPQYSKPTTHKIKIKMPAAQSTASTDQNAKPQGATLNIRVPPAVKSAPKASSSKEVAASTPAPAKVSTPTPVPTAPTPQPQPASAPRLVQAPQPTQATSYTPAVTHQTTSHIPTPAPAAPPAASTSNVKTEASRQTVSASPAPTASENQLKCVVLKTEPRGRSLNLDHRDGVTSWAMRLGKEENSVCVQNIAFLGDEEDEGSDPEDDGEEEDQKGADADVDTTIKAGKRKGKRGRGRPTKVTRSSTRRKATSPVKKKVRKIGEIQVKLNGSIVKELDDQNGKWMLELVVGSNTLEVGEKGGLVWKIYAERII